MNAAERDFKLINTEDLSKSIEDLERAGYRLVMIKPADAPGEAFLRSDRDSVHLVKSDTVEPLVTGAEGKNEIGWTAGRAGMMYRDLVPDRMGGKLIASHIRIVNGGTVNDRVHFHKIDFQIIYCVKGAIKVVYEDQGDPFWLLPGDCVLQPREIRHRVLEAETGSEVIEITSPAEHETWFDHELELPTASVLPDRPFGGARFIRHQTSGGNWILNEKTGLNESPTAIHNTGPRMPKVTILHNLKNIEDKIECSVADGIRLRVLLGGRGISLECPADL